MLNLHQTVFGTPEIKAPRYDEQVRDWATEKLVDGTDSRLRLVGGYKRKLRDCVERSVTFVDETVESLPPPLAVDPRAFTTDGQIRAWFGTIQTLRESFSLSVPVRQFIAEGGDASLARFFAAMRTSINEKTVLVPQLRGDMIQREVPRTAFSFIDHMVVAPAASEEALRLEVKERAYMNLVERSLRHLVSIKRHKGEIEKKRTLLRSKLRTLESAHLGMQPFAAAKPTEPGDVASLMARLDEIESELGQTAASVETLSQLAGRVHSVWSVEELAAANRRPGEESLKAGDLIKVAVIEPYEPTR